ncbi:MAG: hypothetical protein HGA39_08330 [Coriobacteriia bacterium]|nr:hypothetical protein [Coriobacteriia bacterium]
MLVQLLTTPWFAVPFGLAIGLGLLAPLIWSTRLPARGKSDIGFIVVMGAVFGGMIIAFILLLGYRMIAPAGSAYFGLSLVGAYVLATGVYTVISIMRYAKPGNELPKETRR